MWKIPLCDLNFGPEEAEAARSVVASGWLTMGERTQAFERALDEAFGCKGLLAVTNCTAALHLAYAAVGVGPGDEVICPSLTFVATANAALLLGADVVLADIVGPEDLTIDPADVERKITPRTKAIAVVHYAGFACDMDAIGAIAARHGIAVIEDAAHAPLATYKGRALGTIGDVGCYSFFSNKNLSTGEGGAVVGRTEELTKKLKLMRSHGMTTLTLDRHKGHAFSYDVVEAGHNYRIDEIRSAIGLVQLGRLAEGNRMRREVVRWYRDKLASMGRVEVPFREFDGKGIGESSYHIMPVLLPEGAPRQEVMAAMKARGIQTSVHYTPIHAFSFHGSSQRVRREGLERTDKLAPRELTLPLYPRMTAEQVGDVCDALAASLQEVFPA